MLGLPASNRLTTEQIEAAYESITAKIDTSSEQGLSHRKSLKTAFECLRKPECRSEYQNFGTSVLLPDPTGEFKFDWRIMFSIGFYITFAFAQASLSSVEQKPGLRMGVGLGIVACMTEV